MMFFMSKIVALCTVITAKIYENSVNQCVFNTPCEFYNHANDPDCL